jgi:hypothetical protein
MSVISTVLLLLLPASRGGSRPGAAGGAAINY